MNGLHPLVTTTIQNRVKTALLVGKHLHSLVKVCHADVICPPHLHGLNSGQLLIPSNVPLAVELGRSLICELFEGSRDLEMETGVGNKYFFISIKFSQNSNIGGTFFDIKSSLPCAPVLRGSTGKGQHS